jgi:hypothetical protein
MINSFSLIFPVSFSVNSQLLSTAVNYLHMNDYGIFSESSALSLIAQ